jgi:hypothetical protein
MLHGQKVKGWWLITPFGNFKLRGRGGSDTNAAALEMLELLEGGDPGTMPSSDTTVAPAAARKRPSFAGTHSSSREQTNQCAKGLPLHSSGGFQGRRRCHQPNDFLVSVEMGFVAAVSHIQKSWRRDLMTRLNDAQPARKLTNHRKLSSPG